MVGSILHCTQADVCGSRSETVLKVNVCLVAEVHGVRVESEIEKSDVLLHIVFTRCQRCCASRTLVGEVNLAVIKNSQTASICLVQVTSQHLCIEHLYVACVLNDDTRDEVVQVLEQVCELVVDFNNAVLKFSDIVRVSAYGTLKIVEVCAGEILDCVFKSLHATGQSFNGRSVSLRVDCSLQSFLLFLQALSEVVLQVADIL